MDFRFYDTVLCLHIPKLSFMPREIILHVVVHSHTLRNTRERNQNWDSGLLSSATNSCVFRQVVSTLWTGFFDCKMRLD